MDIKDVRYNLDRTVVRNGTKYKLTGCTIRKNEKTGDFFYQAEIREIGHVSWIICCSLDDIEEEIHD